MNNDFELAGSLKFIGLTDLIQLLGTNRSTGTLRIITQYIEESAFIYFRDGNPIDSSVGLLTGIDALNSVFGWLDGEFQFKEEQIDAKNVIKQGRMSIILDALRLLDDGEIEKVGPGSVAAKISDTPDSPFIIPLIKGPLVDYISVVDEEIFFDNEKILEESMHGQWIWVILSGVVEIFKETLDGRKTICTLGEGAFVGSLLSLLSNEYSRGATAVAIGRVVLGVLDSQRLSVEYARTSFKFRQIIKSFEKRLNQVTGQLFNNSGTDFQIDENINADEPLIKQDDDDESLYLITQGKAFVVQKKSSANILLATLCEGDFVGRIQFFNTMHEPYSASVFASKDLTVEKLDVTALKKEYDQISTTFKNLLEHTANCLAVTTNRVCNLS